MVFTAPCHLLVYDVTKLSSLKHLEDDWIRAYDQGKPNTAQRPVFMLVACKADLVRGRGCAGRGYWSWGVLGGDVGVEVVEGRCKGGEEQRLACGVGGGGRKCWGQGGGGARVVEATCRRENRERSMSFAWAWGVGWIKAWDGGKCGTGAGRRARMGGSQGAGGQRLARLEKGGIGRYKR